MPERNATAPTLTRANPARHMTREADVMAPALQSLVWGALVTLVLESGAFVVMDAGPGVNPRLMGYLALVAFPVVSLIAWGKSQGVARATLWAYETAHGVDLDDDGSIGKPADAHPFVAGGPFPAYRNPNPPRTRDDWMYAAGQLIGWVYRDCNHRTGEKLYKNKRMNNGEKLDPKLYEEIRDTLIACDWARWKGKPGDKAGWEFVPDKTAAEVIGGLQKHREERT